MIPHEKIPHEKIPHRMIRHDFWDANLPDRDQLPVRISGATGNAPFPIGAVRLENGTIELRRGFDAPFPTSATVGCVSNTLHKPLDL